MSELIEVVVNGATQQLSVGANLQDLVTHMQLTGKRIAVEHNNRVVPRSQYQQTLLSTGDSIEIVHAIGGG